MKASQFNIFDSVGGAQVIVNTFTNAVIETNPDGQALARHLFANPDDAAGVDHHLVRMLIKGGFLIDNDVDEYSLLGARFETASSQEQILAIAVTTTMQCNFRCTYCYENLRDEHMDVDIERRIIRHIKDNISGKEALRILWWGGEALMRIKQIRRLTPIFKDLANAANADYHASMVSNGFLLTPEVAKICAESGIRTVQITLDGDKDTHDKKRVLTSGRGTFDKIASNILASAHLFKRIILRLNVDRENGPSAIRLLDQLEEVKDHISLILRPVTYPLDQEIPDTAYDMKDFSDLEVEFGREASERGFLVNFGLLPPGATYCNAYRKKNNFSVDPSGATQVCPVYTGNHEERYALLNEDGELEKNEASRQYEWITNSSPFRDNDCKTCKALPVCMGGCMVKDNGRFRCLAKTNVAKKLYYRERIKSKLDSFC